MVHKYLNIHVQKKNYALIRNFNKNIRLILFLKTIFSEFRFNIRNFSFNQRFARMAVTNKKNITKKYFNLVFTL